MGPAPIGLLASSGAAYVLASAAAAARSKHARPLVAGAVILHLTATIERGLLVGYVPLTNKLESFSAAALATAIVLLAVWREERAYTLSMLAVVLGELAAAASFPRTIGAVPPLLRTIWYPLHVPLSFVAYGLWAACAAAGIVWLAHGRREEWLRLVDKLALQGLAVWSIAMICGSIWGVLAWGAYFLWDPKVIWSVILWFHYATFVHLRLAPTLVSRPWTRPVAALVGLAFVFVAFVGTSFFFGRSTHAF
jgi:ABC-type transport system involved in cytochrome c biogenesis permease subunit